MLLQDGFTYGIGQISVSPGDQQEEITESKPIEVLPVEQPDFQTISGNDTGDGIGALQYVLVDSSESLPTSIDYTAQLVVICLLSGVIVGCLLFLAFSKGVSSGI